MKKTIFTLPLFLLLGIIFPIVPAFASSVITSDTFNGTPGDTVPQYNPTDYYLASGYYTDNNANLVIANGGGLKISPASTLNAGGFNTDMTQFGSPTYYCESINFTRNPSDNEVFPELGLHNQNRTFGPITGGTGFTSEFDFHFDTSTVRLEIYNFATGSDLVPYQTFAFNSSTNDHTVKVCDNNGIVTNYVDGVAKETTSYNGATGGDPTMNFAYAPNSTVTHFELDTVGTPPTVGAITAPSSPVLVNTAITASASFTDPDVLDTHTATWNWGDGNTTTGTVTESNGSGSVSDSHTYAATGVYTITLTVADNYGGQGTSTFQYVAVYDSNTSFAGGRSFDNPASASPSTTGKVSFGISSKYSNSNTLTGSVKMNFKAANLDFVSTSLTSLATSNGKAYLKGSGTVNGSGSYTFLATGIDGSVVGGNDLIRFQIKDASNNVVYDSQPGAGDTTDPTTVDATGNIRVH